MTEGRALRPALWCVLLNAAFPLASRASREMPGFVSPVAERGNPSMSPLADHDRRPNRRGRASTPGGGGGPRRLRRTGDDGRDQDPPEGRRAEGPGLTCWRASEGMGGLTPSLPPSRQTLSDTPLSGVTGEG